MKDVKQGEWYYYYPNGKIKTRKYYMNGDLDGVYQDYNTAGFLHSEDIYKAGVSIKKSMFDSLGNVYQVVEFDKKHQVVEYLDITGKVMTKFTYTYNVLNGPAEKFNYGGKTTLKGNCLNGSYDGELLKYGENGKIVSKRNYQIGDLHGKDYDRHNLYHANLQFAW